MRTPNCKCVICQKPLYRRPYELAKVRYVACHPHREEAKRLYPITKSQQAALQLGRCKGTNHRTGYRHREESKRKTSESHKAWCAANPDRVKARGEKNRGSQHYNWKGGASKLNTAIRRLTEHRRWMDAIVRRDGKCMECGSDVDLEAHHKKTLAKIISENGITTCEQARACAELWDLSNGVTLCERCHCKHHGRKYTPVGNGRRKKPRKKRASVAGTASPNYKGGLVMLTCLQCGNTFSDKRCRVDGRRYCSRRCVYESQRKRV